MEYSNFSNDIQIILDIKDRRGNKIRIATIKDIKVKVWTDNPDCFLTFNYHDIQQRSHEDVIVIPQSRMLSLPTGIITYQYSYKTPSFDCHDHHDIIRNQVVRTDLFWKNRHQNEVISNPAYYQSMEFLNDKIDHERKDRIKQIKDIQYFVTEEYQNKLNDEVERAKYREAELEALLNALSGSSEIQFAELKEKIDSEVKRSNDVDIEMFKYIKEVEQKLSNSDTTSQEQKKDTDEKIDSTKDDLTKLVEEEVSRAKKAEKELENKIDENNNKFNLKDIELNSAIEAEVSRAKTEEARIEALVNSSVDNAKDQIKKLKKKVSSIEDSTDGLNAKLDKEISDRTINDNETTASLNAEIKRATTEEARIEGKLDSEVSRAKLVESDIAEALQALKALVKAIESSLNDEVLRSTTEDENIKRLLDILNGNEEVVGSILHIVKDSEHRLEDKIHELQDEFDEVLGGSLEEYASKGYVDERFAHLIGTAPENLDTLEEIAERLKRDDDLFKTIQELLSGKASKEDVYTKAEVDRKEADLQNAIQNEEQRATLVEAGLKTQLEGVTSDLSGLNEKVNSHLNSAEESLAEVKKQVLDEINRATAQEEAINNSLTNLNDDYNLFKEKVNQHIQDGDNNYQEVYNAIVKEETRATNEETKLQNQLDIINGNEEVIGSIKHAIADANHYTDDEIEKLKHLVDDNEANLNNHIEQANNKFEEYKTSMEQTIQELIERIIKLETLIDWSDF